MQEEIQFPIFVRARDSGEVWKYGSIAAMQAQFEKIDVENGEYEAWDANGVPLSLAIQQPIWLAVQPQGAARPKELGAAIIQFAQRSAVTVQKPELSPTEFEKALDQVRLALEQRPRSWLHRFLRTK